MSRGIYTTRRDANRGSRAQKEFDVFGGQLLVRTQLAYVFITQDLFVALGLRLPLFANGLEKYLDRLSEERFVERKGRLFGLLSRFQPALQLIGRFWPLSTTPVIECWISKPERK